MKLRVLFLVSALVVSLVPFASRASAIPQGTNVQTYKSGLNFPVDMAWVSGTRRIFFTEKNTGKIRILDGRKLRRIACANLNVSSSSERGLLGIALHPKFKRNHYLYVYYTANRSPAQNRVKRFTVRDRRCRNPKVIVKGIRAHSSGTHNGGQVEFAGGKLYVSVGDAQNPGNSQNKNNRLGKILRYNPNGTVPDRNPFNNAVWSYGHRNPFGLAHKPGTTKVYSTENGPNCDDEFNIIKKSRNYGWGPGYICGTKGVGPNPKGPGVRWENIVVPTDPTFYRGELRALSGDVYTGDFGGRLRRIVMNRRDTGVRKQRVILSGQNPITDVRKGPGGWLYFATTSGIRRIVRN